MRGSDNAREMTMSLTVILIWDSDPQAPDGASRVDATRALVAAGVEFKTFATPPSDDDFFIVEDVLTKTLKATAIGRNYVDEDPSYQNYPPPL